MTLRAAVVVASNRAAAGVYGDATGPLLVDFLTGTEWTPLFANGAYGVLPILSATLLITGIAMVVAMPLGHGYGVEAGAVHHFQDVLLVGGRCGHAVGVLIVCIRTGPQTPIARDAAIPPLG